MAALRAIVPISQVLFGTDFPYRRGAENVEGLARLGWTAEEMTAVERGNAQRLLPRLR
jgi:predicted TIM-barrel fold metal-dependent hydrolase